MGGQGRWLPSPSPSPGEKRCINYRPLTNSLPFIANFFLPFSTNLPPGFVPRLVVYQRLVSAGRVGWGGVGLGLGCGLAGSADPPPLPSSLSLPSSPGVYVVGPKTPRPRERRPDPRQGTSLRAAAVASSLLSAPGSRQCRDPWRGVSQAHCFLSLFKAFFHTLFLGLNVGLW